MIRLTAFLVVLTFGLSASAQGPVRVQVSDRLLRPSPRALAAATQDEPPPHAEPATLRRPEPKPEVVVDEAPVYKKWWFWALTAAVVGGTVAFGAATFEASRPRARACPPSTLVCFGDGRPQ
jgi:hypothetical protein